MINTGINKIGILTRVFDNRKSFWDKDTTPRKICLKKFSLDNTYYFKGILWKIGISGDFMEQYVFTIAKNRFSFYKESYEIGYVILNECLLEPIEPNDELSIPFGFKLTRNGFTEKILCENLLEIEIWYGKLRKQCIQKNFSHDYDLIKKIGMGHFSIVYEGSSRKNDRRVAVKVIEKSKIRHEKHIEAIRDEVKILFRLNHPSIMKLEEVYEEDEKIYLVLEYLKGGDLFNKVLNKKKYTENEAYAVMRQLIETLAYLSSKDIVHRDIKLENIMLINQNDDLNVKLADFGLAKMLSDIDPKYRCGTPGYVAPEVLLGFQYDQKIDTFSMGVVLYILYNNFNFSFILDYLEESLFLEIILKMF